MTELTFDVDGPVAWVTFNRPEAHNAMTWAMYDALEEACRAVDADRSLRVLVLRGAGGEAFASGTDIRQFQEFASAEDGVAYERRISRVLDRLERVQKPVLAAVEGFAVGGGAAIALACDLRYCTPDSRFGVPIARTLGNCLSAGNLARLIAAVGPARAKELVFRARLVDGAEALALGLVHEVVERSRLLDRVREVAREIAEHAPITLKVTKEATRRMLARLAEVECEDLLREAYGSRDFREGVAAFLDKRPPRFTGE
ncbi:MAG: enoyl-CoA hydratase/isomerase family protein [Clostridia bacterium]|nr:enoyl-CoA hydratase/isomerase family protein [Clostridia bacterium]